MPLAFPERTRINGPGSKGSHRHSLPVLVEGVIIGSTFHSIRNHISCLTISLTILVFENDVLSAVK